MEGILGSASRIVQPPLSMRSTSRLRKSKSQDSDDRRPLEGALATEGVHRNIEISDAGTRLPEHIDKMAFMQSQSQAQAQAPEAHRGKNEVDRYTATTTAVLEPHAGSTADAPQAHIRILHENSPAPLTQQPQPQPPQQPQQQQQHPPQPPQQQPQPQPHPQLAQPQPPRTESSNPSPGKGQAHDPLQDTLFLHIGTGSDAIDSSNPDPDNTSLQPPDGPIVVSESPSAVDIDVYERAYQDEIARILEAQKRREREMGTEESGGGAGEGEGVGREGGDGVAGRMRRPTLYLTRRVEGIKAIRENEFIFDTARLGREVPKVGFAKLVEKASRAGAGEGEKEGLIARGLRGLKEERDGEKEGEKEGAGGVAE